MTSILPLSPVTEAIPTFDPSTTFPEDTSRKGQTRKRLQQEFEADLASTAGQVRHIPPSPSGSSRNPNHVLAFNFVNDHFLNREEHQVAVSMVEGWKPQPWKGQVWYGVGKDNIERVWTGPVHSDLVFDGREWLPYTTPHSSSLDPDAIGFSFPYPGMREVTVGYDVIPGWGAKRAKAITVRTETGETTAPVKKPKTLYGTTQLKAERELNAAYVLFERDHSGQKENFYGKFSAYVCSIHSNAIYLELSERAETHIDAEDILSGFMLRISSLIEKGKYTHQGKIENWLAFQWGNYYFPEVQTAIQSYLDRNIYVNRTDVGGGDEDEDFEHQNHSVAIVDTEEHQVRREQEGYYAPVSRDRIFRRLNKPTQAIVEMLAKGVSVSEIGVKLNISPRQLRRRVDVAAEDGQAVLNAVQTVQACADEDNVLDWPGQGIDIQASAQEIFEPLLGVPEAAKLLCIHPKTLQALARAGSVPCIRMGKYWRFRESSLDTWVQDQLISDHQSRRAS